MEIPISRLTNLEAGGNYYLSNRTGTIKKAGIWQWFKCATGLGDGRAKAQRLAEAVKTSLLASAGISADATLSSELARFENTRKSISGATLMEIANRFKAAHADSITAIGLYRQAYGIAEKVADTQIADWIKRGRLSNDPDKPESLAYAKKIALYSVQHMMQEAVEAGKLPDDIQRFEGKMASTMFKAIETVNTAEFMQAAQGSKLGFPMTKKNGTRAGLSIPRFEFDELHFRAIIAALITRDGLARTGDFIARLALFQEEILQERREALLNTRLGPPNNQLTGFIFAESATKLFKAMEDSEWHRKA